MTTMQSGTDTKGRRTFYSDERDYSIKYTPRALQWFEFLNLHGCLNTAYLDAWTKPTHKATKSSLEALLRMRTGEYLTLPDAQRDTDRAIYNRFVYQLAERGRFALEHEGRYVEAIRPSGMFLHQYLTAAVTASIHLACRDAGYTFIPGHELLQDAETTLYYEPLKLSPDQLFAIDYGDKWRLYTVEVDRGTEPGVSKSNRKSYKQSIDKYTEYIQGGKYKDHLKVDTGMVCLYVFTSPVRERLFQDKIDGKCGYILTQSVDGFIPNFKPLPPYTHLFTDGWHRKNMSDFLINTP